MFPADKAILWLNQGALHLIPHSYDVLLAGFDEQL